MQRSRWRRIRERWKRDKFAAFREAGVNRLSLGIQSFNDIHLQALGRIHSADEARRAIGIAQQYFGNINLDLMYALPNQTLEQAVAGCAKRAAILAAASVLLSPDAGAEHAVRRTSRRRCRTTMRATTMQQSIEELLASHGYEHYETSAFARARRRARHNLNYWQFGDYLGIGAGAHSKLSFPDKVMRQMRHKQPRAYLDAVARDLPVQSEHKLGRQDLAFEFMMNALRLNQGFDEALFTERTGLPLLLIGRELQAAERRGLLQRDNLRIAPTLLGQAFLNDLLQLFLHEQAG